MPAVDPLDITLDAIRSRVDKKHEDWLTATYNVVAIMSERQAHIIYDALAGKLLTVRDADLLQLTAQKLGIAITWQHIDLAPDSQWQEGRGT